MPIVVVLQHPGRKPERLVFQDDTLTIGRADGNDIVLLDTRASARHARLSLRSGRLILEDLKSTNGTLVKGQRVRAPVELGPKDVVTIGDSKLLAEARAAVRAAADTDFGFAEPAHTSGEGGPWVVRAYLDGARVAELPLRGELVIGREEEAHLTIPDRSVSKEHAAIRRHEGKLFVRDLKSANGVLKNGAPLAIGWQPLAVGDVLTLGRALVRVEPYGEELPPPRG